MDENMKEVVNIALANLPALFKAAQDVIAATEKIAAEAGMTPDQIDAEWQAARNKGLAENPDDLPDAVA